MMRAATLAILCGLALPVSACDPFDPDLGDTPFRCGTSAPLCPDGFVCVERNPAERLCVRAEGGDGDGDGDGGIDPSCTGADRDDEPNDDTSSPTITRIPDFQSNYTLEGAEICPEGDVDTYRLRVQSTSQNSLTVQVMYDASAGGLVFDILNEQGTAIASGMPAAGNPDLIEAKPPQVPALPTGTFFVQVSGLGAEDVNSYDINIMLQ